MTLTDEQCVYFAAIFDAGGIIAMYPSNGHPHPLLQIRRSDRALLDVIAKAFGGKVSPYMMHQYQSFYWRARGAKALDILRLIRPHMLVRGDEADRLMRWHPKPTGFQQKKARTKSWDGLVAA